MSTSLMFSGNGDLTVDSVSSISPLAEQKGFHGLWFGETTVRDASILAAVAAATTKRFDLEHRLSTFTLGRLVSWL